MSRDTTVLSLRRMVLGAILVLLVQVGTGITVDLYVSIPARHPGAHPANYFSGSIHSVAWAIAHGAPALAVHASLGLAIVVMAITVAARAVKVASRAASFFSILAGGLVIGAGFNGASFLDFDNNMSSLIMALLALGAVACYAICLLLMTET